MRYLADTSIWVDFLAFNNPTLGTYLNDDKISIHPYVTAEVALGSLSDRTLIIETMETLPPVEIATHDEVMNLIETEKLYSRGIGYVDMHLLASVMLEKNCLLWTKDKRLLAAAQDFGLGVDFMG
ncbi:type II toxin-antitoxin system VapC family toxin [Hellea balneolensis]|uniref:type II toxin-antitoxin system VapC family toxin n=1 Tax=Hellea balneolensis TaxID=287478 RepID=UPI0004182FB4|nr:type II toxin-antitoxin system VapC family toxin [Hellea balneolensis]